MSQTAVAALVNIDQSEVSRLERGRKSIRDRHQLLTWTRALGIPDSLVPNLPAAADAASGTSGLALVSGTESPEPGTAGAPIHADGIDKLVIDLQQRDNHSGGDRLIDEAGDRLRGILSLLSGGNTGVSDSQLHSAVAQIGQMTGWLSLDAGRPADARKHLTTALYAAHMTGHSGLTGSILGYMSLTTLYHGNPAEALALARTAHDTAAGHREDLIGAMLSTRLARALAQTGQHAEARTLLHQAERAFQRSGAERDVPVWLAYFDEAELLAQQGTCLMKSGALDEARSCLGAALEHLRTSGSNNLRDQVHYLIRLADIAVLSGDLDEACTYSTEALNINVRIASTRMSKNLTEFVARLKTHVSARPVRDFMEQFGASNISRGYA